jgi:hypothetical protein
MSVEVELDAYPEEIFEWVLGDIDSTPVTANGVVSYTVLVSIDKWDKTMYGWMTASVKIIIENKENIVVIPTTYIQAQWNMKYVLDKKNTQIQIEVGATDGTTTEIISWLTEWMIIKKTITTSTKASDTSNSFSMPWMSAGMWWWTRTNWWWTRPN